MFSNNKPLIIAGLFSILGGLLHLAIIIGGPDWYRFFGAGEGMAQMAEKGLAYPAITTAGIASVLFIWAAYAFSGAGLIKRLPLLRTGLVLISIIFVVRTLFGMAAVYFIDHPYLNELQVRPVFMVGSSLVCLVYSLFYIVGTVQNWATMSKATS